MKDPADWQLGPGGSLMLARLAMSGSLAAALIVALLASAAPASAQSSPTAVEFTDNEALTVTLAGLKRRPFLRFELTNTLAREQPFRVRVTGLQPADGFSSRLFRTPPQDSLGPRETKPVMIRVAEFGTPSETSYAGSIVVLGTRGPLARRKLTVKTDVAAASACAKADAFEAAGQHEQAKSEYVAVLKDNPKEPCAKDGLDGGLTASLKDALDTTTDFLGAVAGWLAIAAGAILLMALLPPLRWVLVWVPWIDRRLAARLSVQDFGESKAFTALVREELVRDTSASQYRLDRVSGKERFGAALAALQDLDPSVKTLSILYEVIEQLLPRARFTASGALQEKGERGEGATVLLEGGTAPVSATLWMPAGAEGDASHQPLAIPVGAWIDYQVYAALDRAPAVGNARSFAYLQAGLDCQQRGDIEAAQRLFQAAYGEDTTNVAARINDANLNARGLQQYKKAIDELKNVIDILHVAKP